MKYRILFCLSAIWLLVGCEGANPLAEGKDDDKQDEGGEDGGTDGPGTLNVGAEEVDEELALAESNNETVASVYAPKSMQPGTLAVGLNLLQDSGPQFCQDNPSHTMCQSCGPGGDLEGSLECQEFFGPGGEGYTEGEFDTAGTDGGSDGSGGGGSGGDDPCAGVGYIECQPILVRLFINITKQSLVQMRKPLSDVRQLVAKLEGDKGSYKDPDGRELKFDITDKKDMRFVTVGPDGKASRRIEIQGATTRVMAKEGNSYNEVVLDFQDKNNWTTTTTYFTEDCDPNDVRAPSRVRVYMAMVAGVWQGKAMIFSPRWIGEDDSLNCDTTPTADTGIGIYQDFVGEDAYTTASLYMVPSGVETFDATNFSEYGIEKICGNFSSLCSAADSLTSIFGPVPSNPFCNKDDGTAEWGTKCTEATKPMVIDGSYADQDLWLSPATLAKPSPEISPDI